MKKLRTNKLIDPDTQLRLTLWFVGVTALGMLVQLMLTASDLEDVLSARGDLGQLKSSGGLTPILIGSFLKALGVGLSVAFVIGVLITHRVCGPMFRFTQFLEGVMRGELSQACRIRKNDEFHDFCEVLNRATEPMRSKNENTDEAEPTASPVLEKQVA
jgi:nitrogen fixation/metabolism regulation signal transduction histidine kinase